MSRRRNSLRPTVIEKIDEGLGGDKLLDDRIDHSRTRIGGDPPIQIADLGAAFRRVKVIADNLPRDRYAQRREIHALFDARRVPPLDGFRRDRRAPRRATP